MTNKGFIIIIIIIIIHCRSRTASDMTCKLSITFAAWKNLARVAAEEQNGPGLWKFAGESGSDSMEIAN